MPLLPGKSNIGTNINEMRDSGHSLAQSTAAALREANVPKSDDHDAGGNDLNATMAKAKTAAREQKRALYVIATAYGYRIESAPPPGAHPQTHYRIDPSGTVELKEDSMGSDDHAAGWDFKPRPTTPAAKAMSLTYSKAVTKRPTGTNPARWTSSPKPKSKFDAAETPLPGIDGKVPDAVPAAVGQAQSPAMPMPGPELKGAIAEGVKEYAAPQAFATERHGGFKPGDLVIHGAKPDLGTGRLLNVDQQGNGVVSWNKVGKYTKERLIELEDVGTHQTHPQFTAEGIASESEADEKGPPSTVTVKRRGDMWKVLAYNEGGGQLAQHSKEFPDQLTAIAYARDIGQKGGLSVDADATGEAHGDGFAANFEASTALQYVDDCKNEAEAKEQLEGLKHQSGYIGGRVLPKGGGNSWRVQAFFKDEDKNVNWFPDGMRRVTIPNGQRTALGITQQFSASWLHNFDAASKAIKS